MKKITIFLLSVFVFSLEIYSQDSDLSNNTISSLEKGNVIWVGTGAISSSKEYVLSSFELKSIRQTTLAWDLRRIKMVDSSLGLGIQSQNTLYIGGFFESFSYGYFNLGPVVRKYLQQASRLNTYAEGALLFGYDMALADAIGNTPSSDLRYRPGLKFGTSYQLNNRTGFYFEIGPDWEGDFSLGGLSIDSKAIQLQFGVKLINK